MASSKAPSAARASRAAGRHRVDDDSFGNRLSEWLSGVLSVNGRNLPVDTLRGVACILLVTYHVVGYSSADGLQVSDDSAFRYYTDSVEYLRMPLFTLLSGLVYAWRPLQSVSAYPSFMQKKARRLLIPYVIFVPLMGLSRMYTSESGADVPFEPWNWLLYSLTPYWFLLTTFWIMAVVALLDSLDLISTRLRFGTLFAVSLAVVLLTQPGFFRFLQIGQALSIAPFFLAGVAMVRFNLIPSRTAPRIGVTAVFLVVLVIVQLSLNGVFDTLSSRRSIVGISLGILFPLAFLGWKLACRTLAWIGGFSSGIFLLHSFVVAGTRIITSALGIDNDPLEFTLLSVAGVFLSIIGVIVLRMFSPGRFVLGESKGRTGRKTS